MIPAPLGKKQIKKNSAKQRWPFIKKRLYPSGAIGWIVDARTANGGDRKTFETQMEAEGYAHKCRVARENEGLSVFGNDELAAFGKTVQDAIRFYLEHLRSQQNSVPVEKAVKEFLLQKANKSQRYTSDLKIRLKAFSENFAGRSVASITGEQISEWLKGLAVSECTSDTYRRRLSALFAFCKFKKWIVANPFLGGKKAEVPPLVDSSVKKRAAVLSNDSVRGILKNASQETLPFWAIAIFAGLRPESELLRLDWSHIDFKDRIIEVGDEGKTGWRNVPMKENLVQWLLPYAKCSGPVAPPNIWVRLQQDKRKAGFGTPGTETAEEKKAGLKLQKWVPDYTRHTYGSALHTECGNIGEVASRMGNSPDMIKKHYDGRMKPSPAKEFWAIVPDQEPENVVSIEAA